MHDQVLAMKWGVPARTNPRIAVARAEDHHAPNDWNATPKSGAEATCRKNDAVLANTTRVLFETEIGSCSVGGKRAPNEDYVLYDAQEAICVADGIGGAPLGDALSRLACHIAFTAIQDGKSSLAAVKAASEDVSRFVATVDSPASGTSLMVAKLTGDTLEVAWAGNVALFALMKNGSARESLISSMEAEQRPKPLGKAHPAQLGTLQLPLEDLSAIAICTDGAWKSAGTQTIARLLAGTDPPRRIAAQIVLGHPSSDDSTALVAKIHKRPLPYSGSSRR